MLHIEGYLHRDRLAEVIGRWMVNQAEPGDVRFLKKAINFNTYMARLWVDDLMRRILVPLFGPVQRNLVRTKGQIRDFVVEHPTYANPRIEEVRARYRECPEDFFRETPMEGSFYTAGSAQAPRFVGSTRIKHHRRIAEKGSRRIVNFILARIRQNADVMAEERARRLGVPKTQLLTPPDQMVEEFRRAERQVVSSIRQGTIQQGMPLLSIPDVVGAKVIVEDSDYPRLREAILNTGSCTITEEELHTGVYNAVNLRVVHRLPRDLLLATPPSGAQLRLLGLRGFDLSQVSRDYREFVTTGDGEVMVEIIVSSFQEYLESELGRSMHEDRVLLQRSNPDYHGFLATNVRYLMDYILGGVSTGPGMPVVDDVPIKLWIKYMPDTIDDIMLRLFPEHEMVSESVVESTGVPAATASMAAYQGEV